MKGYLNRCIVFEVSKTITYDVATNDADYGGDLDCKHSTSCYIFTLYVDVVSQKAPLQPIVALTTTKAEYIDATKRVKESWLKGVLIEFGVS